MSEPPKGKPYLMRIYKPDSTRIALYRDLRE
jgi:hypothetical protein